jgi:Na+/proline symporter
MIDWLLANHPHLVRYRRWVVVACAAALLGIARLPPNPLDRVIAIAGLALVALVFAVWLAIMLVTILRPRLFEDMRRHRAERAMARDRLD